MTPEQIIAAELIDVTKAAPGIELTEPWVMGFLYRHPLMNKKTELGLRFVYGRVMRYLCDRNFARLASCGDQPARWCFPGVEK